MSVIVFAHAGQLARVFDDTKHHGDTRNATDKFYNLLLLLPLSVQGTFFQPHRRTSGGVEREVESTTVTHSSADWWDLLLPLA